VRLASALGDLFGLTVSLATGERSDGMLLLTGAEPMEQAGVSIFDATAGAAEGDTDPGAVRFSSADDVPRPFRGRTLLDASGSPSPLVPHASERVLAVGPRGPVWVRRTEGERKFDRVALAPPSLAAERLRDAFRPGRFLATLPLLAFAASLAGRSELPPLPAAVIVDDPNLHRERYGFLDFRAIAAVEQVPLHVALAMIPLDTWRESRRAVRIFARSHALSLLIHGNNHVSRELGRTLEEQAGTAQLAQAIRRIERFERRTELRVSRTMAAPHGACSRESIRRMVRTGFSSLVISRPRPWDDNPPSDDVLLGARPVEMVDGLPILPRYPEHDLDALLFAAFLGQPLFPYGHHWDWPGGTSELVDAVTEINRACDLAWGPVDRATTLGVDLNARSSVLSVRLRTRDITLERPADIEAVRVESRDMHEADALVLDGTVVPFDTDISVGGKPGFRLQLRPLDSVDAQALRELRPVPRAIARRALTESRDRLLPVVSRLKAGRHRR
jgi:hypothetical protein